MMFRPSCPLHTNRTASFSEALRPNLSGGGIIFSMGESPLHTATSLWNVLTTCKTWLSSTTNKISVGVEGQTTFDQENATEEDCLSHSREAGCQRGGGERGGGEQSVVS